MPYKNIEDDRECKRRWYRKHRKKEVKRVKERKAKLGDWLRDYKKNLKCARCGENHPACLEFHHKNKKDKETIISAMVSWGYSKEKIKKEIKKCTPLCANCHKKIHYETNHRETPRDGGSNPPRAKAPVV